MEIAAQLGLHACVAGGVEEGPREVLLEPVGVRFDGRELELLSVIPRSSLSLDHEVQSSNQWALRVLQSPLA